MKQKESCSITTKGIIYKKEEMIKGLVAVENGGTDGIQAW